MSLVSKMVEHMLDPVRYNKKIRREQIKVSILT